MYWRINKMRDDEFFYLLNDNESILKLFEALGIIKKTKRCPKCKSNMTRKTKNTEKLGLSWFCKDCKKQCSLLIDSEFYSLKIDFKMILKFAFYFFQKIHFSYNYILHNCGISKEGYGTLLNLFRKKLKSILKVIL
ncbi:hypothetical protein DMUE_3931 [Dictyocoela muelleri]|nr:hypothetical protein DMUE_3931 [Dictyocoela muelleri]